MIFYEVQNSFGRSLMKKEIIIKIEVDIEPSYLADYIFDLKNDLEENFFDWQSGIRGIKSKVVSIEENEKCQT